MDCLYSELKEVEDPSLIQYVAESIHKQEIRSLYEAFCKKAEMFFDPKDSVQDENDTYRDFKCDELDDTFTNRYTIGGQKEKEEEKEKQQQEAFYPYLENKNKFQQKDVKEIIEFWDGNGFGFTNTNAKEQLVAWLDDSSFLQPKEIIVKAMNIACANNKRRLSYVVGILKNWENESLLTVQEIDSYQENKKPVSKHSPPTNSFPAARQIPSGFELNLSAGEE
ncbi:DnaD domain protein [Neobacillus drentensis]